MGNFLCLCLCVFKRPHASRLGIPRKQNARFFRNALPGRGSGEEEDPRKKRNSIMAPKIDVMSVQQGLKGYKPQASVGLDDQVFIGGKEWFDRLKEPLVELAAFSNNDGHLGIGAGAVLSEASSKQFGFLRSNVEAVLLDAVLAVGPRIHAFGEQCIGDDEGIRWDHERDRRRAGGRQTVVHSRRGVNLEGAAAQGSTLEPFPLRKCLS